MKPLQSFIMILSLFIGGIIFSSCKGDELSPNQPASVTPNLENPNKDNSTPTDSVGGKLDLQSFRNLESQVESLATKQTENTQNIEVIKKDVESLKGITHFCDFISWVIAAVALFLSIISLTKIISARKRADNHRDAIKKLYDKLKDLEQLVNSSPSRVKTSYSNINSSEYAALASRIAILERELNENRSQSSVNQNEVSNNLISEVYKYNNEQSGYFGRPTKMSLIQAYFRGLSEVRDSDSLFTATVRGNKAEFKPIDGKQYLNEIKSSDDIKLALNITGCPPSEASQMTVIRQGEAQKDGDRWIITKKADIVLRS